MNWTRPNAQAALADAISARIARRARSGVATCHAASAVRAGNRPLDTRCQLALGFSPNAADNVNAINQAIAGSVTGFFQGRVSRSRSQIETVHAAHSAALMDMGAMDQGRA